MVAARLSSAIVLGLLLLCASACAGAEREVLRQRSPDGRIDAVLIEHPHGERSDFEVRVEPVDPADGRSIRLALVSEVETRGCDHPVAMAWSSLPPPAPNAQTVDLDYYRGRNLAMRAQPPAFRTGIVLLRYTNRPAEGWQGCASPASGPA